MNDNIDLGLLRAFIMVSDELNFNRAAERLNIDQSALSRKIKRLELALDLELFNRDRRGTTLSDAGLVYLEQAKELVQRFEIARDRAHRASIGETGRLRVASMSFAILDLLPRVVRNFREQYPGIKLELIYQSTTEQRVSLQNGEIDIGFMIGPYRNPDISSIVVRNEPLVLALPLRHPLTRKAEVSLVEAAEFPFVLGNLENWRYFRTLLEQMCHDRNVDLRVEQEISNTLGLIGLVAANVGLTVFTDCLRRLQPGAIAVRSFDDPSLQLQTILAWRQDTTDEIIKNFVKTSQESDKNED